MINEISLELGIIIAAFISVLSVAITIYSQQKKNLAEKKSRHKEKYYMNYVEALNDIATQKNSEKCREKLATTYNIVLLIGSTDVINNLIAFHKHLNEKNGNQQEQDNLLTTLFKSIRKDLYQDKNINENYPIINLLTSK